MASPLVVRSSSGTTTKPDQRQRRIEHQATTKNLPITDRARLSPSPRQPTRHTPQLGLPALEGEVGFTTSLIAQKLAGERRKYAALSRPTSPNTPQTRLRDFLV
jgi:hypothetical protein